MGETIISFVCALAFVIVSVMPWMELKDTIPLLIVSLTGYSNGYSAVAIVTTILLGIAWLILFFVLWHKLEKDESTKKRLIRTAVWIGCALVLFGLAVLGHALVDVYLIPRL